MNVTENTHLGANCLVYTEDHLQKVDLLNKVIKENFIETAFYGHFDAAAYPGFKKSGDVAVQAAVILYTVRSDNFDRNDAIGVLSDNKSEWQKLVEQNAAFAKSIGLKTMDFGELNTDLNWPR